MHLKSITKPDMIYFNNLQDCFFYPCFRFLTLLVRLNLFKQFKGLIYKYYELDIIFQHAKIGLQLT